jgi:hypothetical protein
MISPSFTSRRQLMGQEHHLVNKEEGDCEVHSRQRGYVAWLSSALVADKRNEKGALRAVFVVPDLRTSAIAVCHNLEPMVLVAGGR